MSAEATVHAWRTSPYKGAALVVHLALADAAGDDGVVPLMGQAELAGLVRSTRKTVNDALLRMEADGLLECQRQIGNVCHYRLLGVPQRYTLAKNLRTPRTPPSTRARARSASATAVTTTTTANPPIPPEPLAKGVSRWFAVGDSVAKKEWNRRKNSSRDEAGKPNGPVPVVGFPAFRLRIIEALDAGHSPERVAELLPSMPSFSRSSFDFALNKAGSSKPNIREGSWSEADRSGEHRVEEF